MEIKPGTYKHYKGQICNVIGTAQHSETLEPLVVYEHPDDDGNMKLWVRPKDMFLETIEVAGEIVPRFEHIEE